MGRNTYEAEHYCLSVKKNVAFRVIIGNPPTCPECRRVVYPEPVQVSTPDFYFKEEEAALEAESEKI